MVMVPLSRALTTFPGTGRGANAIFSVQVFPRTGKLFWVTKGLIIRNPAHHRLEPTPRQAEWRLTFAELSANWKGARGTGTLQYDSVSGKHKAGDTVLAVQAKAQTTLKGQHTRLRNPPKTVKRAYRVNPPEVLRKKAGLA